MTDTDLNAAEANHRNIKALAKELDADDVLSKSVAPRGSRSASETAKFMGLSSSSDDDDLSNEERTAALVEQNARNLRALAKAAGADAVAVESDEDERNNRQKLMGL